MTNIESDTISNLMLGRRLLTLAREADDRRNGKKIKEKSALDYFQDDQVFLSDSARSANKQNQVSIPPVENVDIKLSDIKQMGPMAKPQAVTAEQAVVGNEFVLEASQQVEVKLEVRYKENTPVDGLQVYDKNFAESDRYLFQFKDGSTFTILDKWANKSTTIWGDPHIDVSDVEGSNNGDFQDMKGSNDVTTLMLADGSQVTFKAKDDGLIEQVDIYKGSQHVQGVGQGAKEFLPETGLFNLQVKNDGNRAASASKLGDVVFAGGDGNDWFDAGSKLIWGKTTGPVILQRPSAILEFSYKQTVTQSISIQTISRDA